eukprot:1780952-Pyramimonas_sp.AAC.1
MCQRALLGCGRSSRRHEQIMHFDARSLMSWCRPGELHRRCLGFSQICCGLFLRGANYGDQRVRTATGMESGTVLDGGSQ